MMKDANLFREAVDRIGEILKRQPKKLEVSKEEPVVEPAAPVAPVEEEDIIPEEDENTKLYFLVEVIEFKEKKLIAINGSKRDLCDIYYDKKEENPEAVYKIYATDFVVTPDMISGTAVRPLVNRKVKK